MLINSNLNFTTVLFVFILYDGNIHSGDHIKVIIIIIHVACSKILNRNI